MAIELIAKIKQKNNGIFKLVDACDVEMKDGQDLQTCIDNLVVGEGLICVHDEDPTEEQIEKYEVFIDKSATLQETSNKVDNVFLEEIRNMFNSLQKTIDEQQQTIFELVTKVKYLESLHGDVDIPVVTNTALLLENGGYFLLENRGILLLEEDTLKEETSDGSLLTENGKLFLLENGGKFLLENSYIEIEEGEVVIKLESGGDLLLENGGKLLMELSEEEYNLLLETGKVLLTEKNGKIILE
jgi:hypothetical protein